MSGIHWGLALEGRLKDRISDPANYCADRLEDCATRLREEIAAGELPFVTMPYRKGLEESLPEVMSRFVPRCAHMLVLGIGGSALGARALQKAFAPGQDLPGHKGPWLWIADNVDSENLEELMRRLPPAETVVVVISKSGGTIETMAQYFVVKDWLKTSLGDDWKRQVLIVTDAKNGALRQEAAEHSIAALEVPDHLGGRYSVLSAVGMVPAYFCGMNWPALLHGAASVMEPLVRDPASLGAHPAWSLACWAKALMDNDYSQLIFFSYTPSWAAFGSWFAQLWAESLGKGGKGSMPLPAVGVTDQHSMLQMFLDGPADKGCLFIEDATLPAGPVFGPGLPDKWSYLKGKSFGSLLKAEAVGTLGAFAQSSVPLVRMEFSAPNEENAGKMMSILGLATIFTGWLLNIDPLDQPAVEYGKRLANARLGAAGYEAEEKVLAEFFNRPDRVQEI